MQHAKASGRQAPSGESATEYRRSTREVSSCWRGEGAQWRARKPARKRLLHAVADQLLTGCRVGAMPMTEALHRLKGSI